ncbi:MAG: insulinase family protein, partial [Ruminococcus sp.]|nr:insulinase family protein [Ruminococcus sp.]
MNMTKGTKLCGFTVERVREVKELSGELVEMIHDKTGAQLCWMNNGIENKVFCVGFKTIPQDSTGVFHILEHSVLCGSEKYPVKEPFVDLLKSSMNTFLNAMTYPDKTVYPVASRNEQDFLNLTSVYLDAVFAPALTTNPNVFYQEGIHTELNDGKPSYKGVVFNEMKGALSSVNDKIEYDMNKLIFPDNCYRFNSGGDPAVIPDLTYEHYAETYRKFYHPSNSRFFLDGDIPLEATLSMINSYLERYEKKEIEFDVEMQTPVSNEGTSYYEIDSEEGIDGRDILALGKIVGTWKEKTKLTAAKVLCDVLADSNESPLKRAILSENLADDVEMGVMDSITQPYLITIIRNTDDSQSEKIRDIIRNTVSALVNDGISKEALHASINRLSFSIKQISEPQGLYRALSSYNSWLYGGDPLDYLVFDEMIAELRQMVDNGGFEKLPSELMLDENGTSV